MSTNPFKYFFHTPQQLALLNAVVAIQDDEDYYEFIFVTRGIYPSLQADIDVYWFATGQVPPERLHNVTAENGLRQQFSGIHPVAPTAVGAVFSPGELTPDMIERINAGTAWQTVMQEAIRP